MQERYYDGKTLEKDLKMCAILEALQNNNDVIVLNYGDQVLVHEMEYIKGSSARKMTGKTHIGFDYHYITFYYKGRVWSVEPSTYYPFTDDNHPGEINAIPYELINGWCRKQIGYWQKFESIEDCEEIAYPLSKKDYEDSFIHNLPFNEDRNEFEKILKQVGGFRERTIYEVPHICYTIEETKERRVIRCSKLEREKDGVRLSFNLEITHKIITN